MAFSAEQRAQAVLLPIADGSINGSDRYALAYLLEVQSELYTFTDAQRWQIGRLPIADSSITTGDEWQIANLIQSLNTGGANVQFFDLSLFIDPAFDVVPPSRTGDTNQEMGQFTFSLPGSHTPPILPEEPERLLGSGGYGFENEYDSWRQRTKRRRKIRKTIRRQINRIENKVDREIAQRLHAQIEREAEERELLAFKRLLQNANQGWLIRQMENRGLLREYEEYLEKQSFSATQRLERLMEQSYTWEEEVFLMLLMLQ